MKKRLLAFCFCILVCSGHSTGQSLSGSGAFTGSFRDLDGVRVPDLLFVDAAAMGANTGTSWADAFTDLQDALGMSGSGGEIWVAAGTYKPAPVGGPNTATFQIPSGVAVFGGFAGGETSLGERDVSGNPTILSGDLAGDDTYQPVFNVGFGDNTWHVVTLNATSPATRLDGFSIIAGHSFGGSFINGAGILILNGGGTLANCEVSWSVADNGGGAFVSAGSALIEDCSFHNNYASTTGFAGGALANDSGSSVVLRDSTFTTNTADGTYAGIQGGAIANASGATMSLERCLFSNNKAKNRLMGQLSIAYGGAIYNAGGTLVVDQSTFVSNTSNAGGALYSTSTASTVIRNSLFRNNTSTPYVLSGGIEGGGDGGAVVGGSGLVMTGCLVYGGSADNIGGVSAGAGLISGCIFWGNQDNKGSIGISQIKADEVRYSCVENMLVGEPGEDPPEPEKFPGSIDTDPLFANAAAGDFRPTAGSPVIDAGENAVWPPSFQVDLDGNPRLVDDPATLDTGLGAAPLVDMGPFEFDASLLVAPGPVGLLEVTIQAGGAQAGRPFFVTLFLEGSAQLPFFSTMGLLGTDGGTRRVIEIHAIERSLLAGEVVRQRTLVLASDGVVRVFEKSLGIAPVH